jgi:hypothetical protein
MKDRDSIELAKFQDRTVELLAHKFEVEYSKARKACPQEEIEHYFQVWAPGVIREIALRKLVWRSILTNRRAKARSK